MKKEKITIEQEKEKITIQDVLGSIMTNNVNISNEEYKKLVDNVTQNYNNNNDIKDGDTLPSLEERRERIKSNYYGTSTNFLFQILNTLNDFYRNYTPLIEAIAEKVGVDFDKVQSEEDKAMKEAATYLRERAMQKKAERELTEKKLLNRENRRKIKKETGEIIKFKV